MPTSSPYKDLTLIPLPQYISRKLLFNARICDKPVIKQ